MTYEREGEVADGRDGRLRSLRVLHPQHRPRTGVTGPDQSQGQRTIPGRRDGDRRYHADPLAVILEARAGGRARRPQLEPEPLEDLVDVSQCVDPRDRLLAEITTLDEADRPVIAADLLRQVLLGDVLAEHGRPRL